MMRIVFTLLLAAFLTALLSAQTNVERPSARAGHSLVYDQKRKQALLLDGYQRPYQPDRGEIWAWKGQRWTLVHRDGPAIRSLSGVVYDSRRDRVVVFGGVGKTGYDDLKGDTWEWDGRVWHQMPDQSVGTRDHHVMAYDAARGKTVMYGGQTSARACANDTWEWDGKAWKQFSVPGPGCRAHFAMVYDSKRRKVVLFGGIGDERRYRNDTWEWDGKTWTQVATTGPSPRASHRMAYDNHNATVWLYGGGGFDDMWKWDGDAWTQVLASGPSPGKRNVHAMAYDADRKMVVLYGGGNDGQSSLADTWEWDGRSWAKRDQ